jgi:hypothetical protein
MYAVSKMQTLNLKESGACNNQRTLKSLISNPQPVKLIMVGIDRRFGGRAKVNVILEQATKA